MQVSFPKAKIVKAIIDFSFFVYFYFILHGVHLIKVAIANIFTA